MYLFATIGQRKCGHSNYWNAWYISDKIEFFKICVGLIVIDPTNLIMLTETVEILTNQRVKERMGKESVCNLVYLETVNHKCFMHPAYVSCNIFRRRSYQTEYLSPVYLLIAFLTCLASFHLAKVSSHSTFVTLWDSQMKPTPPYLSWLSHLLMAARRATACSASCHFPWCRALVKLRICSQNIQAWEVGSCGNLSLAFSNTTVAKWNSP